METILKVGPNLIKETRMNYIRVSPNLDVILLDGITLATHIHLSSKGYSTKIYN